MAKDVNIHVKTDGTPQVQRDLDGVAQSANKVGENVEQMGSRSSRAMDWFASGLKSLAGPLGFAALVMTVSSAAGKISQFFSDFKNRCDEAVGKLQNVRKSFEGVFEAMNAFDEKSRKGITADTINLLKKTSVSQEVGLPVIAQYARQFQGLVQSGQLSPEQYQQGLEGMLGFAARRGKAATPELITLMAGLGMKTPEQQGAFRRQVEAVAGKAGLTIEDMVDVLARATPTATAMGWQPDEMLNYIGILAAGTVGRQKMTLPTATLQALVNPQVANLKDYRINARQAENPAQLLQLLAAKQQTMNPQAFGRMLNDIYGAEGGAGVYKLLNSTGNDMTSVIKNAATPQVAIAETAIEQTSRETRERQQAKTDAVKIEDLTKRDSLFYKKQVRELGKEQQDELQIEHPGLEYLREVLLPDYKEAENAAFIKWLKGLSPEEQKWILSETKAPWHVGPIPLVTKQSRQMFQLQNYYNSLTPEQRYHGLVGDAANKSPGAGDLPWSYKEVDAWVALPPDKMSTEIHYHHEMIYYPSTGSAADRDMGPRAPSDLR